MLTLKVVLGYIAASYVFSYLTCWFLIKVDYIRSCDKRQVIPCVILAPGGWFILAIALLDWLLSGVSERLAKHLFK
jgi:hypothetical protein